MREPAYPTPEAAARGEIPERYSRVLGWETSPDGRVAFVLLGTNEPPDLHPYLVCCFADEQGWTAAQGTNGDLFVPLHEDGTGGLACWGEAPEGAVAATVRHAGTAHEVAVRDGCWLVVRWGVDDGDQAAVGSFTMRM